MKNKHIGTILDGRWKIIKYKKPCYTLMNIYNQQEIVIYNSTLYNILNNKTSISKVIYSRLKKEKVGFKYGFKRLSN